MLGNFLWVFDNIAYLNLEQVFCWGHQTEHPNQEERNLRVKKHIRYF